MIIMIINEISSTLVQRYGENRVNAILNRNISYLTHHIKKICEFVYDEGIDISKVQRAFQQYEQLKKQGEAFDYRNLSFSEFVNKLQTPTISVQLPNVIFTSNDKMIQIGRFDTFEEANSFQKQTNITCCFCTNKVWWNIYKGHGAELYIIHNLYQSSKSRLRYVIVVSLIFLIIWWHTWRSLRYVINDLNFHLCIQRTQIFIQHIFEGL